MFFLVGCCLVLLYRLAQYITNTVRFDFATSSSFRLANFKFQISNFKFRSLGPPVAAGEPGSLQPAVAACSLQFDRGYLLQYNLIQSSRIHIVLKKGPKYRYPMYFEKLVFLTFLLPLHPVSTGVLSFDQNILVYIQKV